MIELLPVAIGIGLAVSLLFSELFGLAAGGMIVPGYIAMNLTRPVDVALTLGVALVAYAVVHALSSIVVLYGRRRTALMILFGFVAGAVVRLWMGTELLMGEEFAVIGFIIPGLIAIWMERQGIVETVASLLTASVAVRLVLVLTLGAEVMP